MGRSRRAWRWVRLDARERIAARLAAGESARALAVEFGCSGRTVTRIAAAAVWEGWRVRRSPRRLSFAEREHIGRAIAAGQSAAQSARGLGRQRSTIGRAIALSGGGPRSAYRAVAAERRARQRARRPKPTKLAGSPRLLAEVEAGLERRWSPQQIAARLKVDHPDDGGMRISHETIYRSLFVQARGELRRQLAACAPVAPAAARVGAPTSAAGWSG